MSQSIDHPAQSRCLLILGMHRSGTSATTRSLNLCGMDVGSHLLNPDNHNQKGYWEHADAVRINDRLLSAFGMAWWSLDPLPEGWVQSKPAQAARKEIADLVSRDFTNVPLWGIKDPRLCRLAPLWIDCLGALGVAVSAVFTTRPPLEVARSLLRAQGLSEGAGVLSWILHLAESERATRELPRSMVPYDQLLAAPVATLERVARDLDIDWPVAPSQRRAALTAFLDSGLRTNSAVQEPSWVPPIAGRMEDEAQQLAVDGGSDRWSALGRLSDEAMELVKLLDYRRRAPLPHEVVTPAHVDESNPVHASLFQATDGEDFSEAWAVHRPIPLGRSQIEFPVSAVRGVRHRLDPASRSGYYVFHSVILRDAEHRLLWAWEDFPGQVELSGIYVLESASHPGAVVHRVDADPQMLFSWPEEVIVAGAELVLDIERFDVQRIALEFHALERQFGDQVRALEARRAMAERELKAEQDRFRAERDARERSFLAIERNITALEQAAARQDSSTQAMQHVLARQEAAMVNLLSSNLRSRVRRRFFPAKPTLNPVQQLELIDASVGR